MNTNPYRNRANLLNEIDQVKNYYEHRRRVQYTRNISPLTTLKKSMSYDRQKLALHQYLKSRINYSKDYQRRCKESSDVEALKSNEEKDSKMLQNILEYDSKQFVFSLNQNQSEDGSLHHNSMMRNHYKSKKVDQQNQKLHFRLTKARSFYSHLFPCKSAWGMLGTFKNKDRIKSSINGWQSGKKIQTQEDDPNVEEMQKSIKTKLTSELMVGSQKVELQLPSFKGLTNSNISSTKEKELMRSPLIRTTTARKICERVRRQKLALNLFEKKQKWQSKVISKLRIQKE